MKVSVNKEEKTFTPINVSFTIETEEEAKAFKALFNTIPLCDYVQRNLFEPSKIWASIPYDDGEYVDKIRSLINFD